MRRWRVHLDKDYGVPVRLQPLGSLHGACGATFAWEGAGRDFPTKYSIVYVSAHDELEAYKLAKEYVDEALARLR